MKKIKKYLERMKINNKIGFTLVELLAVIIILSLIALVTLPVVSNIMENTRKAAFVNSVYNATNAVREQISNNDFEEFPSDGILAKEELLALDNNPFISGKFRKIDGKIEALNVTDGRYCASGSKDKLDVILGECYLLDKTGPVAELIPGVITSNSIQVVMDAYDEESNIVNYQFSIDNGATWTSKQTSNSYTYTKLRNGSSFNFKARVTNQNDLTTEKSATFRTLNIDMPKYTSNPSLGSWSKQKIVTINYPVRQSNFIYEYSTDNARTWSVVPSGNRHNITFSNNGNLTARVRDGYNTVTASTLTITTIDITSPTIPTSKVKYDSSIGTIRANDLKTWTNKSLWWGEFKSTDSQSGINHYEYSNNCNGISSGTLEPSYLYDATKSYDYCIRAVDKAGNISAWSSETNIRVDKTAPSCTTSGGSSTWTKNDVSVTGTCNDSDSGCKDSSVIKNIMSTTDANISAGTVSDNAGNETTCPTALVKVDKTAPSCTTSGGSSAWTNSSRTLIGTCSDSNSGCANSTISNLISSETNSEISPGNVLDKVGNANACPANTVKIDKTKPYTPIIRSLSFASSGYTFSCTNNGKTTGDVNCTFTAKDKACTGGTTETYWWYGDTASANASINSGYRLEAQYSCTGIGCFIDIGNGRTSSINRWTEIKDFSKVSMYAGQAGNGVVSRFTLLLRLVDGAGNASGTLNYSTAWCV